MSSTPGVGHRLDEQAAHLEARAARGVEHATAAAASTASSPSRPSATPPTLALVRQPDRVELERDRAAARPGAPRRRRRRRGPATASVTSIPAARGTRRLVALGEGSCRARPARGQGRRVGTVGRPVGGQRRPAAAPRPTARRRSRRPVHARGLRDRRERLQAAAQERRTAALRVEQRLGLGRRLTRGQRHVHGQDRRAVARSPRGAGTGDVVRGRRPRTAGTGTGSRGRARARRRRPTRPSPRRRRRRRRDGSSAPHGSSGLPT